MWPPKLEWAFKVGCYVAPLLGRVASCALRSGGTIAGLCNHLWSGKVTGCISWQCQLLDSKLLRTMGGAMQSLLV